MTTDPAQWELLAMSPVTKTWLALLLVFIALFEFWSAMRVFGRKDVKNPRWILRAHRAGGYAFGAWFLLISFICLDMMERLAQAGGYDLDARSVGHAVLSLTLFAIFLLKVSFIRFYRSYRPYVPLLGVILVIGTLVLWGLAGLMFLYLVGSVQTVTPVP